MAHGASFLGMYKPCLDASMLAQSWGAYIATEEKQQQLHMQLAMLVLQ